jgi:hypothetical protein
VSHWAQHTVAQIDASGGKLVRLKEISPLRTELRNGVALRTAETKLEISFVLFF